MERRPLGRPPKLQTSLRSMVKAARLQAILAEVASRCSDPNFDLDNVAGALTRRLVGSPYGRREQPTYRRTSARFESQIFGDSQNFSSLINPSVRGWPSLD